jgi:hypothetical protein
MGPDLSTVLDVQSGEALDTQDYWYGLLVIVVCITASDKSTTTRGIEIGGLKEFGLDDFEDTLLGTYCTPRGVIDEFQGPWVADWERLATVLTFTNNCVYSFDAPFIALPLQYACTMVHNYSRSSGHYMY